MVIINENEKKFFEFELEVRGSQKGLSIARLVFEGQSGNKMFPIHVNEIGRYSHCVEFGDVDHLKSGKVYLEVIAEGAYFTPWEDEYIVKSEHQQKREAEAKELLQLSEAFDKKVEDKITNIENKTNPKKINESVEKSSSINVDYKKIKENTKSFSKNLGANLLEGDTSNNVRIKNKAIALMQTKYGSIKELNTLKKIKLDELLIF